MIHGADKIEMSLPRLYLGETEAIQTIASEIEQNLNPVEYHPSPVVHHSWYCEYINKLGFNNPIATHNSDFLRTLLNSNIEFQVITCMKDDKGMYVRVLSKEKAKYVADDLGLDLR